MSVTLAVRVADGLEGTMSKYLSVHFPNGCVHRISCVLGIVTKTLTANHPGNFVSSDGATWCLESVCTALRVCTVGWACLWPRPTASLQAAGAAAIRSAPCIPLTGELGCIWAVTSVVSALSQPCAEDQIDTQELCVEAGVCPDFRAVITENNKHGASAYWVPCYQTVNTYVSGIWPS